jgi:hypothetical protein
VSAINKWKRHTFGSEFLADLRIAQCAACGVVYRATAHARKAHARLCEPVDWRDTARQSTANSDTDASRTATAAVDSRRESPIIVVDDPTDDTDVDESSRRDRTLSPRNDSARSQAAAGPITNQSPSRSSSRRRTHSVPFSDVQAQNDELVRHQRARRRSSNNTPTRTQSRDRLDNTSPVDGTHRHVPPRKRYTLSDVFSADELPKLYNAERVLDRVPDECIPQWIAAARAHLLEYQHHRASDDAQAATNALWTFFTLPVRMLQSARTGHRRRRQTLRAINRRLASVLSDIYGEEGSARTKPTEIKEKRRSTIAPDDCLTEDNSQSDADRTSTVSIRRAIHLATYGYYGKANRALKYAGTPAPAHTPEVQRQLTQLHPQVDEPLPRLPGNTGTRLLSDRHDMVFFSQQVSAMDNGSAGGLSQWSGHMLAVLAHDTYCLKGLMSIVNDIINGDLTSEAKSFITASRLVPIYKDANRDRVRPIAVGEILPRLASRILTSEAIPLAKPLLVNQHGIGKRDGTAQVVHQLQTRITDAQNPMAAITLDIRNAFNECSRRHVMDSIYARSELSLIWRYVDFNYSQPSELWTEDADGRLQISTALRSKQGVRQGDPLSPLLFAVAWQSVDDGVTDEFKGKDVKILSFHDDTTIVAPVDIIFSVYDSVVRRAGEIGLQVQPAKCGFLYLHSENSPPLQDAAARIDSGVIPRSDVLTVLGTPVGKPADRGDNGVIKDRVNRLQLVITRLLDKEMPKQIAFTLLHKCVQFQLDYLLRMVEPSVIETTARQFDEMMIAAASAIIDLDMTDAGSQEARLKLVLAQLRLPISVGGCGLRSAEGSRHIAFFAAHVGAIRDDPIAWAEICAMHPASYSALLTVINQCVVQIRRCVLNCLPTDVSSESPSFRARQSERLDCVLPTSRNHTFSFLRRFYERNGSGHRADFDQLQTVLTRLANKSQNFAFAHHDSVLINALPDSLALTYRAHLMSLSNHGAGRWLSVAPRIPALRLGDVDFVGAIRARLFLQPHRVPLTHCEVCERDSDQDGVYVSDPLHGLSCRHAGGCKIMRHNSITGGLVTAARKSGATPEVEPAGYDASDNRRPDVFVVLNGRPTFIDSGVVHSAAPSHRGRKKLAAAKSYVQKKVEKYQQLAANNDAVIIPFIVETGGGYTDEARYVVDDIVAHAYNHAMAFTAESIRDELKDTIAIAIQRGNAMAMRRCREKSLIDRQRRSRLSVAQRRRIRARRARSDCASQRRRYRVAITPRRARGVHVDTTTDGDEQQYQRWAADPSLDQSVILSTSPHEDRWELNGAADNIDEFGIVNVEYSTPTSSAVTQEIECVA